MNVNPTNIVIALMFVATFSVIYFLHTSKQTRTTDVAFHQNPPSSIEVESANTNTSSKEATEESSQTVDVASSQTKPSTSDAEKRFYDGIKHFELCLELGTTMRGFSGPRDRMNIFKSYGYSPSLADTFEGLLQKQWRQMDLYDDPNRWRSRYNCYQQSVNCQQFMEGFDDNRFSEAYDEAIDKIDECLSVDTDKKFGY